MHYIIGAKISNRVVHSVTLHMDPGQWNACLHEWILKIVNPSNRVNPGLEKSYPASRVDRVGNYDHVNTCTERFGWRRVNPRGELTHGVSGVSNYEHRTQPDDDVEASSITP